MMWKFYIISPHVLITLAPKLQWEKMPSLYVPEAVQAEYEKFRATELKASIFQHGPLYHYYRPSLCVSFQNWKPIIKELFL